MQTILLPPSEPKLPVNIERFLVEAEQRIDHFQQTNNVLSFVPSNHRIIYHALQFLASTNSAPGNFFCEWGSGFGVAACLAAMTGWKATGIEINASLVDASQQLAADFGLNVEFHCDSFIPQGSEHCFDEIEAAGWLTTHAGSIREETGISPENFDAIFVYPWPGEEQVMESLFERHAAVGSLLMTFAGREDLVLHRKVARNRRSFNKRSKHHRQTSR